MSNMKILFNGLIKENPIFVLMLGMCPTLATTTSAINGLSMGLATMFVSPPTRYASLYSSSLSLLSSPCCR